MKWCLVGLLLAVVAYSTTTTGSAISKRDATESIKDEEKRAAVRINELNDILNALKNKGVVSSWAYASNITDENQKINNEVSAELAVETKVTF